MSFTPSRVLIVDDEPVNVHLLRNKLEREGLDVTIAFSGLEALKSVGERAPDLILLDLMMPDMDGFEVCRRLQAEESTRAIPIIFVTARTEKECRIQGLDVGAVDYITKPIDLDETFARVRTHLRLIAASRQVIQLQRRLADSRRVATIGAVTHGIAHNMNNLLSVAIGYLDYIQSAPENPDLVRRNARNADAAIQRIVGIIAQLSAVMHRSRPPLMKAPLQRLLDCAAARFLDDPAVRACITIDNPLGDLTLNTNLESFEDIIFRVVTNAWESYGLKPAADRPIRISALREEDNGLGDTVVILIEDRGRGVDPEIRDRIFEPFVGTKDGVGVGMGLTIARHALRNLGGDISVESRPGGGTTARLYLPRSGRRPGEGSAPPID